MTWSLSLEEIYFYFFVKSETIQQMIRLDGAAGECAYFCLHMHFLEPSRYIFMHLCVCVWVYRMCVPKWCQPPHRPNPPPQPPTYAN